MDPQELDKNRYTPPEDAALLLEQIRADLATKAALRSPKLLAQTALDDCHAALVAAQAALHSAQSAYGDIVAREAELDLRVSHARGHFQSLRKLPDEILGIVFHEWLLECPRCWNQLGCDHVCMLAAAVCRWWRRVALGLPILWRGMEIRFGLDNARHVHNWVSYMDAHRTRSGRMGLYLDVSGIGDKHFHLARAGPELLAAFYESVKRCFGQARVLVVNGDNVYLERHLWSPGVFDQDAPYLVDFRINIAAWHGSPFPFFRSAPILQRLTLGRSFVLTRDPGHSSLLAVTDVELLDTNAQGLRAALLSTPNIVSLKVSRGGLASTSDQEAYSVHSETLRVLKWTRAQRCEEALVCCMRFPRLVVAELEYDKWSPNRDAALAAFLQYPMHTVQELTLDYLDVGILSGLRHTQHVTFIRFKKYTKTSEAALQSLSQPAHDAGWLLARLSDVCLPSDTKHFGVSLLQDAILNFATARGPTAAPVAPWSKPQALQSVRFKSEYRLRTLPRSLEKRISDILIPDSKT